MYIINYTYEIEQMRKHRKKSIVINFTDTPTLLINVIRLVNLEYIALTLNFLNMDIIDLPMEFISRRCGMIGCKVGTLNDLEYIKCQRLYFASKSELDLILRQLYMSDVLNCFHSAGVHNTCLVYQNSNDILATVVETGEILPISKKG